MGVISRLNFLLYPASDNSASTQYMHILPERTSDEEYIKQYRSTILAGCRILRNKNKTKTKTKKEIEK